MNYLRVAAIAALVTALHLPVGALAQQSSAPVPVPLAAFGGSEELALLNLARLAAASGKIELAENSARGAYAKASDPRIKFDAALFLARSAVSRKAFTRAQLWLRRADHFAPGPDAKAYIARLYRQVAAANPFRIEAQLAFGPSNNVNNGTSVTTIIIGGLPFEYGSGVGPLDGFEAEAGVTGAYRLSESPKHKTEVFGQLHRREVRLSASAQERAPDVRHQDLASTTIVAGLRHRERVEFCRGPVGGTFLIGKNWFGDAPLAAWAEVQLQSEFPTEKGAWHLSLSGRSEARYDDALRDSTSHGISGSWVGKRVSGLPYSISLAVNNVGSASGLVDQRISTVKAAYTLGAVGPVYAKATVAYSQAQFRKWVITPDDRRDDTIRVGLEALFPDIQAYGFIPRAIASWRFTDSNVDVYDREEVSFGIAIQSRF